MQGACGNEQFLISNLKSDFEIDIQDDKVQAPIDSMVRADDQYGRLWNRLYQEASYSSL